MIRIGLLSLFCIFLACYAWKDWYRSLCGLVTLMAVIEHPDMPRNLAGIQGLNPWNLLLLIIVLAFLARKGEEDLHWDMPRYFTGFLLLYFTVVGISFVRLVIGREELELYGFMARGTMHESVGIASLVSDYFVNCFKWVVPGVLLFIGCRSRDRFRWGVAALLLVYILLGIQVIRWMPPSSIVSGEQMAERSLKILVNEVGFHRVNLAMMLAGAAWATIAVRPALKNLAHRKIALFFAITTAYAMALTAGRTGYATWLLVGLLLSLLRWRKNLLLIPIACLVIVVAMPSVVERMSQGFTAESQDSNTALGVGGHGDGPDAYTITSGRTIAWPFVIEKIKENPVFGYGRLAMQRTGITAYLLQFGEEFGHPHNAYLELLLDMGVIGFVSVLSFYVVVVTQAIRLFRDRKDPFYTSIGGIVCSLVFALLIAGMGSQTFYPREGSVAMWCAIMLMMRVWVERKKLRALAPDGSLLLWPTDDPAPGRLRPALAPAPAPARQPELVPAGATNGGSTRWIPPQRRK